MNKFFRVFTHLISSWLKYFFLLLPTLLNRGPTILLIFFIKGLAWFSILKRFCNSFVSSILSGNVRLFFSEICGCNIILPFPIITPRNSIVCWNSCILLLLIIISSSSNFFDII